MYWQIGQLIIEDEQGGKEKAVYGKAVLKNLSRQLTQEFGKGFDETNLRNIRQFYLAFQKRDALRHELSWTHYRIISRIEHDTLRQQYINHSIEGNWDTSDFFIDLVFYNYYLKCFLLIDLKNKQTYTRRHWTNGHVCPNV